MEKTETNTPVLGSFRDPSGFLFYDNGTLYRQVNNSYKEHYDAIMGSGLYKSLVDKGLLISHEEINISSVVCDNAYKTIKPELIPVITYPYEWCFSQLRDAALLTLEVQKEALNFGMTLKDSSVYNVQFRNGRPVFIDTLSLEKYSEGQTWVAYKQFCQHFLAPLALMAYRDIRLSQLFRVYIDGIPLDLASSLLPVCTYLQIGMLSHIHLHAKSQKHFSNRSDVKINSRKMPRLSFLGLIDNLESVIKHLEWKPQGLEWTDYYDDNSYTVEAFQHKKQIINEFLDKLKPDCVWDFGANAGIFSNISGNKGIRTLAFDSDPSVVEKCYLDCVRNGAKNVLPLLLDLTNPSPAIGWANEERMSLLERGPVDTIFALALIHHLAISNNVPFDKIADFLAGLCKALVIEFVPKDDPQVQKLLATRKDIFPDYSRKMFELEFGKYFAIESSIKIKESERVLFLMRKKQNLSA